MRTIFGSIQAPSLRALFTFTLSLMMIAALQISVASDAEARKKRRSYKRSKVSKRVRGNPKYAAIVIDAKTGKILHSRNANATRYPASLTKMMTLYLIFEDLKSGRIKKRDRLVMTRAGWRRQPSKLGLKVGQSISIEQGILSLVTKSANDVATAFGDKLAGSEKKFAKRMTRKARQLGMKRTTFKNANGLTARGQTTTAADMAKLGLALREHFPRRFRYFQTRNFKFGRRNYRNHNRLLGKVRGVDGIKTGYTRASGFNLVSSVSSNRRRIVAVVMGGRSGRSRNAQMKKLIRAYLPKASRGAQRRIIARAVSSRGRSGSIKVASIAKPSIAKKVGQKIATRIKNANANSTPNTKEIRNIQKKIVAMAAVSRPKPVLRQSLSKKTNQKLDTMATSSVRKRGWQIQIAASDTSKQAMRILKKVKTKNKNLLSAASPFTQKVRKNGITLYRARFSGFRSKKSAARACKILKQQKYACLALKS